MSAPTRINGLAKEIGSLRECELILADALDAVAARHERDPEVRDGARRLAAWSRHHAEALSRHAERHGAGHSDDPQRLRAALFHGARVGGPGLLRDLHDLALLADDARLRWTALEHAARAVHDRELEDSGQHFKADAERQLAWLRTQIEHASGQALAVEAERADEIAASMPKTPRPASTPEALWAPLGVGGLILAVGLIGLLAGRPWLLPSLGPTAFLQAEEPAHPSARFFNVVVGHLGGLAAGFAAVAIFNAWAAPAVLTDHRLVFARVLAAAVAVVLTALVGLALHASHPPAGATTLLVALGSIRTPSDALNLALGAVLIAALGEGLRRARLRGSPHGTPTTP